MNEDLFYQRALQYSDTLITHKPVEFSVQLPKEEDASFGVVSKKVSMDLWFME